MIFTDLDLNPNLLKNIKKVGFSELTAIQSLTVGDLLAKRDVVGVANTGTGKTAAFLIPIINNFLINKGSALVIVPTRELAIQVNATFKKLTLGMDLESVELIGGINENKQISSLQKRPELVVGTPGRLIDLLEREFFKVSHFDAIILDEFDKMLDMGFVSEVQKIWSGLNENVQKVLFSATDLDKSDFDISKLISNFEYYKSLEQAPLVTEQAMIIEQKYKYLLLGTLIKSSVYGRIIVFLNQKKDFPNLEKELEKMGIKFGVIHADKTQSSRTKTLQQFSKGEFKILLASDVLARGVDIHNVTHVINFDFPLSHEDYIHRIGRTARAGRKGKAITFYTSEQKSEVESLAQTKERVIEFVKPPVYRKRPKTKPAKKRR